MNHKHTSSIFRPWREKQIVVRMKAYCKAFTLIELLVVVLIIGILTAVAVPQYQKAVTKSDAVKALALLRSIYEAEQVYYLANGDWTNQFSELDIDIPSSFTGTRKWSQGGSDPYQAKSDGKWSFVLENGSRFTSFSVGLLTGRYTGGAFLYQIKHTDKNVPLGLFCIEYNSNLKKGDFCEKIMGGTFLYTHAGASHYYKLPY